MGKETTLQEIWESWDYHLREAFERADSIARKMFAEASLFSVPREKQEAFFKAKTAELLADIARQANGT